MLAIFEKIIEKLEKLSDELYKAYCIGFNSDDRAEYDAYINAIEIVKQEAEQYNNGWIPCSERLPEERETVLLQDFDGFYELGVCTVKCGIKGFEDGDWWSSANNFIAWKPLPEPYQPKGE